MTDSPRLVRHRFWYWRQSRPTVRARARGWRSASLVATCWFASSTPLLLYSFEPNVDTIFVAGYMTAAYFFLRASRTERERRVCLGALAAGQALGTKSVGVVSFRPSRRRGRGDLAPGGAGRTKIVQTLAFLLRPAVHGGLLVFPQCDADGQSALSARGSVAGRVVSSPVGMGRRPCGSAHITCLWRLAGAGGHTLRGARPEAGAVLARCAVSGPG